MSGTSFETNRIPEVVVLDWPDFELHAEDLVRVASEAAAALRPAGLTIGMKEYEKWRHTASTQAAMDFMRAAMIEHLKMSPEQRWRFWANHILAGDESCAYSAANSSVGWHRHRSLATGVLHVSGGGAFRTRGADIPFTAGQVLLFELDLEHCIEVFPEDRISYALDALR